jgi:hypothetical protein
MKRAATYARASTHNGQNPEMQLEEIRRYCASAVWCEVEGEQRGRSYVQMQGFRWAFMATLSEMLNVMQYRIARRGL